MLIFDVLLTVHYDINFIPVTNLMHKFLYSYSVTILQMFRAVLCSSSGGQIVCIQLVVSSLCTSGCGGGAVYCTTTYNPLHVSSSIMLILRRSDCTHTAYGIVTLCEWTWWSYSTQVERDLLMMSILLLETCRVL